MQVGNQVCPVNAYFQKNKRAWAYIVHVHTGDGKSNGDACGMKGGSPLSTGSNNGGNS